MTEGRREHDLGAGASPRRRLWLDYVPGWAAGLRSVGYIGYVIYTRVLSSDLSWLARAWLATTCAAGLAFVGVALWPLGATREVQSDEISNFWMFLLGSEPSDEAQRALWRKFRRCMAVLVIAMLLLFGWGVIVSVGLAKT